MRAWASLLALTAATQAAHGQPVCMQAVLAGEQGHRQIVLEIAHTPDARARGLMGRTHLPPNEGMLFVFDTPDRWHFWMRNTPIPLDIVPLDGDGRVVEVLSGVPYADTLLAPTFPVRRVLEVAQGTIEALGALPPHGALVLLGGAPCPSP